MKKILSAVLYGTIIVSVITGNAKAQANEASPASSNVLIASADVKMPADKNTGNLLSETANAKAGVKAEKANLKALKANAKAVANFKKDFKDDADVQWTTSEETISAYMFRNNVQTRVVYDKKGNRIHTMLFYFEDNMPTAVRSAVKQSYPKYSITGVQEIQEDNNTFYVVHIENEKGFKEVTVYDGELNTYREFNKAR